MLPRFLELLGQRHFHHGGYWLVKKNLDMSHWVQISRPRTVCLRCFVMGGRCVIGAASENKYWLAAFNSGSAFVSGSSAKGLGPWTKEFGPFLKVADTLAGNHLPTDSTSNQQVPKATCGNPHSLLPP